MKKIIVMLSFFATALAHTASSQTLENRPVPAKKITLQDALISGIKTKDGSNTVQVPNGKGTLTFVRRGEKFSNVVFKDAAGKVIRLTPQNGSTGNLPQTCKYKLPDACFGSDTYNVFMCICRPNEFADANDPVTIGLLLPAVQRVREAAATR